MDLIYIGLNLALNLVGMHSRLNLVGPMHVGLNFALNLVGPCRLELDWVEFSWPCTLGRI